MHKALGSPSTTSKTKQNMSTEPLRLGGALAARASTAGQEGPRGGSGRKATKHLLTQRPHCSGGLMSLQEASPAGRPARAVHSSRKTSATPAGKCEAGHWRPWAQWQKRGTASGTHTRSTDSTQPQKPKQSSLPAMTSSDCDSHGKVKGQSTLKTTQNKNKVGSPMPSGSCLAVQSRTADTVGLAPRQTSGEGTAASPETRPTNTVHSGGCTGPGARTRAHPCQVQSLVSPKENNQVKKCTSHRLTKCLLNISVTKDWYLLCMKNFQNSLNKPKKHEQKI